MPDVELPFDVEAWWAEHGEYVADLTGFDRDEAEYYAKDEWRVLKRQFEKQGGLEVFRAVTLDAETAEEYRQADGPVAVGRFWTRDSLVARSWSSSDDYDGHEAPVDGRRHMLRAAVPLESVDAAGTVAARLASSYEDEIRLSPGAKVRLSDIEDLSPPAPGR